MKKITVLFTVLLMLAASTAFAVVTPEFPAYLNGTIFNNGNAEKSTKLFVAGMGMNKTQSIGVTTNAPALTFFNSSKGVGLDVNATGKNFKGYANFTGRLSFANASNATLAHSPTWAAGMTFNYSLGNINGLTIFNSTTYGSNSTRNVFNATSFFVPVANHQALIGLTNSSYNGTSAGKRNYYNRQDGLSMLTAFVNGTFNGVASSSDTWDYYAYGVNALTAEPVLVVGQVQITADTGDDNARVKYTVFNGTKTENHSSWITYNATGSTKNNMALVRSSGMTLLNNATINVDRNLIVGTVNATGSVNANNLFVVMIKNGSNLSSSDLKGHSFRQVYVGSAESTSTMKKITGNATGGIMQYSFDEQMVISGEAALFNATSATNINPVTVDLNGFSAALSSTGWFGLSQSNMTIYDTAGSVVGAFYGKQNAEKTFSVGIYQPIATTGYGYGLAFVIPTSASAGPVVQANAAYQANGTFTFGAKSFQVNSTGYTKTGLRNQWTGIPSNFTPLTDVKGFNATVPTTQKQDYYTFQFAFDGVGDQVKNLRLYKVFPTSDKTVREFDYAGSATPAVEGAWWISSAVGDGYLNQNSYLTPANTYYVNWVIKDNGNYDYKTADKLLGDPVVFGSVPTSSSSSSSGCVFNPAAGFGLEWLLLMLAPMVAIVRSRFKK